MTDGELLDDVLRRLYPKLLERALYLRQWDPTLETLTGKPGRNLDILHGTIRFDYNIAIQERDHVFQPDLPPCQASLVADYKQRIGML